MLRLPWCSSLCRKCGTFFRTHTHTPLWSCETTTQRPQLLVCRKLLSADKTKAVTSCACGTQTPSSVPGCFKSLYQSLLCALHEDRAETQVDEALCIQNGVLIMLFADTEPLMNAEQRLTARQRQRSRITVPGAR